MSSKQQQLETLMSEYAKEDICLAFSGGVDSSLLLKVAADAVRKTGKRVLAVTFDTKLHPSCDLETAKRVAGELGGIHDVISVDELEQEAIRSNPVNRCYLCKRHLFETLKAYGEERGVRQIMDGTNEDDLHVYRPGIKALSELQVLSPLAAIHITKEEVKAIASGYGISVASRPSTPCMATRLPYDTEIDYGVLRKIEKGETYLRGLAGGNVRLRLHKDVARIEADAESLCGLIEKRGEITARLKELGFIYITLDLEGFRSGSMDVNLD